MAAKPLITIIGIGLSREDISPKALRKISTASVLIGGSRQLAFFPDFAGEKIVIGKDAAGLVKNLAVKLRVKAGTVVLASGDPNFYGIAALFYEQFPKNDIEVLPNITAFQAAFARIKEPWDGACFISVHGRNIRAVDKIVRCPGVFAVYCDRVNTPAAVAAYLLDKNSGLARAKAWIFDGLGTRGERIASGTLKKMLSAGTSALSMMIIKNANKPESFTWGIPDDQFARDRGMITRRDMRLLTLARLEPADGLVLWDIGAGSGSVSIEAARACSGLQACAIEKDPRRFKQLQANVQRFHTPGVRPVQGEAPGACAGLPRPDRIFIGGSGGALTAILNTIKRLLTRSGIVVVNCVTLDSLNIVLSRFKKWGWRYEVTLINISRLASNRRPEIFRAGNPVYIVQGRPDLGG